MIHAGREFFLVEKIVRQQGREIDRFGARRAVSERSATVRRLSEPGSEIGQVRRVPRGEELPREILICIVVDRRGRCDWTKIRRHPRSVIRVADEIPVRFSRYDAPRPVETSETEFVPGVKVFVC